MAHKLWDKEEEKEFIKQIGEGRSMSDIAIKHERTETAMELRLKKIIYDNIEKGYSAEKLSKIIKLPQDKINQYYYEYKGFIEKKDKIKNSKEEKLNEKKEETKISTMNIIGGYQSEKKDISDNNKDKMAILEKENRIMKEILDNIQMKNKINKLIDNGYLDKDIRRKIGKIVGKKTSK